MRKIIILAVLIFILEILDNTFMSVVAIHGYAPSLLLIFVFSYAIINEGFPALGIGIISGAVQDLFFINGFGVNTLINMLLCVLAGQIGKNLFKERRLMPVLSILLLCFLKGILLYGVLRVLHINTYIYGSVYTALYSFVIAIFVYKPIYNLCQKSYMIKDWKF